MSSPPKLDTPSLRTHWSDWPFLGLGVLVLAMFIDSCSGSMRSADHLLCFAHAMFVLETAPILLLLFWAPCRFAARGYSRIPPALGVAAGLLAILTWITTAAQAAAGC